MSTTPWSAKLQPELDEALKEYMEEYDTSKADAIRKHVAEGIRARRSRQQAVRQVLLEVATIMAVFAVLVGVGALVGIAAVRPATISGTVFVTIAIACTVIVKYSLFFRAKQLLGGDSRV